jgi:DNA-directed RNA polymerase subunit RPC12/RpoP
MSPAYCAHCGQPVDAQGQNAKDHEGCRRAGALDPPRFCTECGRRMIVKVTPDRWTAQCSRHGAQRHKAPRHDGDRHSGSVHPTSS